MAVVPLHAFAFSLSRQNKPYNLCYYFLTAQCKHEDCQYVYWVEGMEVLPDQEDWADDNGTENVTIPSQTFKSCGIGQKGDDSMSHTMHPRKQINSPSLCALTSLYKRKMVLFHALGTHPVFPAHACHYCTVLAWLTNQSMHVLSFGDLQSCNNLQ